MPRSRSDDVAATATPPARPERDLLIDAVELFVRASGHDRTEIRAFALLVDGLLDGANLDRRRRVASALAARADTPPSIARRLALDTIEVAEAMIERSPVLTSGDLGDILRRGPAHARRVAARLDLPTDIAGLMVDTSLVADVAREAPANRRENGARPPVLGRRDREVAPVIVEPEEIVFVDPPAPIAVPTAPIPPAATPSPTAAPPPAAANVPTLRAPVRGARTRGERDPAQNPALDPGSDFLGLDAAARWRAIQTAVVASANRTKPPRRGDVDVADTTRRLLTAAVIGDKVAMRDLLCERLGLAPTLVARILIDRGGEALTIVLLAVGVAPTDCTSILLHVAGSAARYETLQDLTALAERTPRRAAEALVSSWRGDAVERVRVQRQTDAAERPEAPRARGEARPAARPGRRGDRREA